MAFVPVVHPDLDGKWFIDYKDIRKMFPDNCLNEDVFEINQATIAELLLSPGCWEFAPNRSKHRLEFVDYNIHGFAEIGY